MFDSEEKLQKRFMPILQKLGGACARMAKPDPRFLLAQLAKIEIHWAPFHSNAYHLERAAKAKVLFVGLTGGFHQAKAAYKQALEREAGNPVSFKGPMRAHLLRLSELMGLHTALSLESLAHIFEDSPEADLFMSTSLLRFPVYRRPDLGNYSGTPSIASTPELLDLARTYTGALLKKLSSRILIIPFGKAAQEGLLQILDPAQAENVLLGFPHPSGGNGHREKLFRERRPSLEKQIKDFAKSRW